MTDRQRSGSTAWLLRGGVVAGLAVGAFVMLRPADEADAAEGTEPREVGATAPLPSFDTAPAVEQPALAEEVAPEFEAIAAEPSDDEAVRAPDVELDVPAGALMFFELPDLTIGDLPAELRDDPRVTHMTEDQKLTMTEDGALVIATRSPEGAESLPASIEVLREAPQPDEGEDLDSTPHEPRD